MSKQSIDELATNDFEAISLYYQSGNNEALSQAQKDILDRWQSAYSILRQYPAKHVACRKLMLAYRGLSRAQAMNDVNNSMKFFNKYNKVDREFTEIWFLNTLMEAIADKNADEYAKAKNLATLQKYLAQLPPVNIDPKLLEKNTVIIQVNNNIAFTESDILKLPTNMRQRLLDSVSDNITETQASEIIDS